MKLQLEGQHLRVRIDEDELARLLCGKPLDTHTRFAGAFALAVSLSVEPTDAASIAGRPDNWNITLPEAAVRELAGRLPTREGLRFLLLGGGVDDALTVVFDVDVRDSVRRRRSS
jgi:hypothetical protein